jgi:hypothetical protein
MMMSMQQQQQQQQRMSNTPNMMGISNSQTIQSPLVYMQPQQLQQQQNNNGMMMVVTPQRKQLEQQQQLQQYDGMMMVVTPQRKQELQQQQGEDAMMMVVTPQRKQEFQQQQGEDAMMMVVTPQRKQELQQQQGEDAMMMVVTPQRKQELQQQLGEDAMMMAITPQRKQELQQQQGEDAMMMVVTPQRKQLGDESYSQGIQQDQQQYMATASIAQINPEQYMATASGGKRIPVVGPLGSSNGVNSMVQDPQQQQQVVQQGYAAPQNMATELSNSNNNMDGTTTSNGVVSQQELQQQEPNLQGNVQGGQMDAFAMQQQAQLKLSNVVEMPPAQLQQLSPAKQAVYYYDPKDTTVSQDGDILQLPKYVYDMNGKAVPLSELRQAPIYVQPPMMGSSINNNVGGNTNDISAGFNDAASVASNGEMQAAAPVRETVQIPQWGKSSSQDQTIIVATVAVMALLVGALSARRLRSKSFLASCIENETLEDDMAYDSAYTTAAGGVGADSSYNTFGGWKGDLEKFDV